MFKSPWDFHGLFGGPTDKVGDSFNFFVRPSSKLCVSDAHLRVKESMPLRQLLSCEQALKPLKCFCVYLSWNWLMKQKVNM